ncbi:polyphosphate kinase 2 [Luteimonas terricola]|uniref:ADP/GDP-polyphosphate phosphotransferase n=1 Tax=Luteimonas terricola TaxID=645597 RepID=A0ABQ2EAT7_9GAMM|nr:polyphosphate kinase 2 [Luteimonas terricola]GGK00535.1 transcriptional regulator [Luteimonas terricola]
MAKIKGKAYAQELEQLQHELVAMARWARHRGERIVIVLEGRDTAGKGGTAKAITEHLDTRQYRVAALPKPSEAEQGQWYFQRYVPHLPTAGEIVLFDRSWYNRAGVEQVMGFATDAQVEAFLKQAPVFEKLLVDDGIHLFKYWLCCNQEQQEERFAERREDPLKAWKLSPIDREARLRYDDYTRAREAMLEATHTAHAPWTLVDYNHQKSGRLTLIRDLLDRLPDVAVPAVHPEFPPLPGKPLRERYGALEPIPRYAIDND